MMTEGVPTVYKCICLFGQVELDETNRNKEHNTVHDKTSTSPQLAT
jgi:hypothetical protein